MNKRFWVAAALLALVAFIIPIEHKYDKIFRFFSLTLIPEGLEISNNFEKKIYFYVSDLIAIALTIIGLSWFKIPFRRFFGHPLWIIFLCAFGSILASPFVHYPIPYFRLIQLSTPLLLFSFLANAFSEEERSRVMRIIFFSIVIAGVFQSIIGIAQYFHEAPLGLRLLGESNTPSTILIQDGSRWIFDRLFAVSTSGCTKMRAAGTFPHANVLGGFLVLSILMTYSLILQSQKRKWVLLWTLPLQLFALYLTYSRSALFAWGIGTVIWFGLVGFKERSVRILAGTMTLLVFAGGALLYQQILDRGGVFNYNAVAKGSDAIRLFHQNLSWKIMKDNPVLGLGFTQYSEQAPAYLPESADAYTRSTGPHNVFLFLACETGLISLCAFLFFLLNRIRGLFSTPNTLEKASLAACFFAFLFISCCDFYPILFQQGKLMFFLILGLLALLENRKSGKVVLYG